MSEWLRVAGDDCLALTLHVQPGARKTEFAGMHGDALKVRLAAPPVGGKANMVLLRFVAAIILKSGHTSRRKVLEVRGATRENVAGLVQPS